MLEHEVISAVSREYFSVNSIDLIHNFYEEISEHEGFAPLVAVPGENAQIKLDTICTTLVAKEYQNSVMNFFDLSTVPDRMQDSDVIEIEYFATDGNWHQARFIEKKRNKEGKVTDVLYVTRIVSKEKQQEIEQERLRIAYQVAERANEAKTTFLLNMSHDIRTPMNAIIGFTALAQTHIENTEQVQDYLAKINTSSTHLLSLINDILDMSRIESGSVKLDEKPVHMPDLLHDLRTMIQGLINAKQLNLYIDTQDVQHEDVITDKLRLNQVLINIVGNAIKFTPVGGDIGIEAVNIINEAPEDKYDLVLMDIQMPRMDGYTATREIRTLPNNRKANIPIVAMTANAFDEDRRKAFECGMNGHIVKPINMKEIVKILNEIWGES